MIVGNTYFIAQKVVEKLKLLLTETANYNVIMRTSMAVKGKQIFKGVVLDSDDLIVIESFLPLDLDGVDVILGIQWLHI